MEKIEYRDAYFSVDLYQGFLTPESSECLFQYLQATMNTLSYRRKSTIIGDEGLVYRTLYSESAVIPWSEHPMISVIRDAIQQLTGTQFTVCIVQYYHTGRIGINPHRDREMVPGTTIAGLSVGATRVMRQECKMYCAVNNVYDIVLNPGSLYTMNPPTNDVWSHCILKDPSVVEPRFSLTFRNYRDVQQ